jgi:hypothetical protein
MFISFAAVLRFLPMESDVNKPAPTTDNAVDESQSNDKIDVDAFLSGIASVEVTPALLSSFKTEDAFMALTVELAKEAGSLVAVIADITPPDSVGWDRNHAIIV